MPAYGFASHRGFSFVVHVATTDTDKDLVAAPGAGKSIVVQSLTVCITTSAAQAVDIEDNSGTVELFKLPASLAAGTWSPVDAGPLGIALTANEKLYWNAGSAGVGATVSGFGYIRDN